MTKGVTMKIVLLGAPGAGKGTQAELITKKFNLEHISTGDMFRKNIKEKTPVGIKALQYIEKGQLVPDEVTIELVKTSVDGKDGYMLDGFPRNIEQAQALDGFADIDCVINIDVETGKLMNRLTGRRVCGKCSKTYHISTMDSNVCVCGAELIQRSDDMPETVLNRLEVYEECTKPLIEHYTSLGKLVTVDGDRRVEDVFADISEALEKYR